MKVDAVSNIKLLKSLRSFPSEYWWMDRQDFRFKAATVFLREERTSKGKKLCVVMRVNQRDWLAALSKDIVELVWIPTQRLAFTRFQPVLLKKDCSIYESSMTTGLIHDFINPRVVPGVETLLSAYHLQEVIAGRCYCCNHYVHPKLSNQDVILEHLAPIVEQNKIATERYDLLHAT